VAGVSLSVTLAFGAKVAVHVLDGLVEQLIPAGVLMTVPVPAPVSVTVNPLCALKIAATFAAAVIVMVQAPVPVQLPLQPPNV
jgi:hypothetical protein